MPQTNEGVLLLIGALFLLLGLLGGGFEISAIKIPPVGKYTRAFAFVIGSIVFGLGVMRLVFPTPTPAPAVAQITAPPPPTAAQTIAPPSPLPPTQTPAPSPVNTTVPPTALPPTAAPTLPPAQTSTALAALIQNVSVEYDQTRFEKNGHGHSRTIQRFGHAKSRRARYRLFFTTQRGSASRQKRRIHGYGRAGCGQRDIYAGISQHTI